MLLMFNNERGVSNLKYFTKKLRANRIAKKIVVIMYTKVNRYCLWDSPRYVEKFTYGDLYIEISPNNYYDGSDPPDVLVKYKGELVLHAVARELGGGLGGYRINAFREGDWLNVIEELYKLADGARVAYRQAEKEKERNRFSPID